MMTGRARYRQFILITCCILAGLSLTCEFDRAPTSSGALVNPPYWAEAEQMAIYYGRTMYPNPMLARKFSQELYLIRSQWGDSMPGYSHGFQTPWTPNVLGMWMVDSVTAKAFVAGEAPVFNSLIEKYDCQVTLEPFTKQGIYLHSSKDLNPCFLRDEFGTLPGVISASPSGQGFWSWISYVVRMPVDRRVQYVFYQETCGDFGEYFQFEIRGNRAVLLNHYDECAHFTDSDSLPDWMLPVYRSFIAHSFGSPDGQPSSVCDYELEYEL